MTKERNHLAQKLVEAQKSQTLSNESRAQDQCPGKPESKSTDKPVMDFYKLEKEQEQAKLNPFFV